MPAPKPAARRPIAPAASPAPRAKKIPALALVGRITVAGEVLQVAKNGRVVANEPMNGEGLRADLRHCAQYYFGRGGVLKRSLEQRGVWLVFQ